MASARFDSFASNFSVRRHIVTRCFIMDYPLKSVPFRPYPSDSWARGVVTRKPHPITFPWSYRSFKRERGRSAMHSCSCFPLSTILILSAMLIIGSTFAASETKTPHVCESVDTPKGKEVVEVRGDMDVFYQPAEQGLLARTPKDRPNRYAIYAKRWEGGREWLKIRCRFEQGKRMFGWVEASSLKRRPCITLKRANRFPEPTSSSEDGPVLPYSWHWGCESLQEPEDGARVPAASSPDDLEPSWIPAGVSACSGGRLAAAFVRTNPGQRLDELYPTLYFNDGRSLETLLKYQSREREVCLDRYRERKPLGDCPDPPVAIHQSQGDLDNHIFPVMDIESVATSSGQEVSMLKVKAIAHAAIPRPYDWRDQVAVVFVLDTTHSMICGGKGKRKEDDQKKRQEQKKECARKEAVVKEVVKQIVHKTRNLGSNARLSAGLVSFWYEKREADQSAECSEAETSLPGENGTLLRVRPKNDGCYKAEASLQLVGTDLEKAVQEALTRLYDFSNSRSENSPGIEEDLCFALQMADDLSRASTNSFREVHLILITDAGALVAEAQGSEKKASLGEARGPKRTVCTDMLSQGPDGLPNANVSILHLLRGPDDKTDERARDQYIALANTTGGVWEPLRLDELRASGGPRDLSSFIQSAANSLSKRIGDPNGWAGLCEKSTDTATTACETAIASLDGRLTWTPQVYWTSDRVLEDGLDKSIELGLIVTRSQLDKLARRTERVLEYFESADHTTRTPPFVLVRPTDLLERLLHTPDFLWDLPGYRGFWYLRRHWERDQALSVASPLVVELRTKLKDYHRKLRNPYPRAGSAIVPAGASPLPPHDLFFLHESELP